MKENIDSRANKSEGFPNTLPLDRIARRVNRAGFCSIISNVSLDTILKDMADSDEFKNSTLQKFNPEELFIPKKETLLEMNSDIDDIPISTKYEAKLSELSSQKNTIFLIGSFKSLFDNYQKNNQNKKVREEMIMLIAWFLDEFERGFEHFREDHQNLQNNSSAFLVVFSKEEYSNYLTILRELQNGNIRELHPDITENE